MNEYKKALDETEKAFAREEAKLKKRRRNDEICFWAFLVLISVFLGVMIGLLLRGLLFI